MRDVALIAGVRLWLTFVHNAVIATMGKTMKQQRFDENVQKQKGVRGPRSAFETVVLVRYRPAS